MLKEEIFDPLIETIDEKELLEILCNLISMQSHINYPGREKEVGLYIYNLLKKEKIETTLQEVEGKRCNVIAKLGGQSRGKKIALNGHLDTVDKNNRMKTYGASVCNGKVYGLGAADMKGAIAAMIYSLVLLKRKDIKLDGEAYFTGVIGEESGGTGTRHLVKSGFRADYCIVGEPTDLKIVNSHKGCYRLDITINGKAAHASMPEKGANSIAAMGDLISALNREYMQILRSREDKDFGSPTLNYGVIRGGKDFNIVADECTLSLDRRWIKSENKSQITKEIESYVREVCLSNKNFEYDLIPRLPSDGFFSPFFTADSDEIIEICKKVYNKLGMRAEVSGMQGWTDAATLQEYGLPVVILGPGSITKAHSFDESVLIDEVITATKIYLSLVLETCLN